MGALLIDAFAPRGVEKYFQHRLGNTVWRASTHEAPGNAVDESLTGSARVGSNDWTTGSLCFDQDVRQSFHLRSQQKYIQQRIDNPCVLDRSRKNDVAA